jgi:hypothetical protein
MSEQDPKPASATKRRWFQFTLRTLFVVVTAFACWLGWNAQTVHRRARARHGIEASGGEFIYSPLQPTWRVVFQRPIHGDSVDYAYEVPWVRRILGDSPARIIFFDRRAPTDEELQQTAYFPEAIVCTR